MKIQHNYTIRGQPQGLKKVTCVFWEVEYAKRFETLEKSGSQELNKLTRCDDYAGEAVDHVVPAATKYSCVSKFNGKYVKFAVSQKSLYMGSISGLECFTAW